MDKKYQVSGKKWRTIGGRKTLVNSKDEIFKWDSKKGEIEVYTKGKKRLGGFDPFNRQKQISKPVSRTPNGANRIPKASFFDKLGNLALPTLFIEALMIPQTSTGIYDSRYSKIQI